MDLNPGVNHPCPVKELLPAYSCFFCCCHRNETAVHEKIHFVFNGTTSCWAWVKSICPLVKVPQCDLTESFQRDSQYVTHFLTVQDKSLVSNLQKYCVLTAAIEVTEKKNINVI